MQNIVAADTEQIFLDWGRPATLEEIQSFYDPGTGLMEESVALTTLQVIAGPLHSERLGQTAAVHSEKQQLIIVRAVELPESIDLLTARIQVDTQTLQIKSIVTSYIPDTVALDCVSLSP